MGGTRFKDHDVSRISAADYNRLQPEMIERLAAIGIEAEAPRTFAGKTSYGDMDLVASEESLMAHAGEPREDIGARAAAIETVSRLLGAEAYASSGPRDHATSYAIPTDDGKLFQLDLITHPESVVDYARRFYSWGDTGALISVTARAMGLRNKATGLHYIAGYSTDQLDIHLPVSFDEALKILGFDAHTHRLGFADQDEVFAWLMAGREFDPRVYDNAYLTERSRRRSRTRAMQVAFQEICKNLAQGNAVHPRRYEDQSDAERYAEMAPYRARTAELFPFVREVEAAHIARFEEANKAKVFYSADRLTSMTGLTGRDVKLLMWQLTKDARFKAMMKTKDEALLAAMVDDMTAWSETLGRLSGESGSALYALTWEITKSENFSGDVLGYDEEDVLGLIGRARLAMAEAKK